MLTQEQIKKLKHGDKLLLEASFIRSGTNDVELAFENDLVLTRNLMWNTICTCATVSAKTTPPKHDPTRLFREGDKVRPVKRRGRYYSSADEKYADLILTVHSDEVTDSRQSEIWVEVETEDDKVCWNTDPVYLELVTPVEELEPYFVIKGDLINGWDVCKQKNENICCTVATFTQGHPNAKAAAEAERDRLNAEWRKEQNNGNE